jgi:hypothetical protein
MLHSSQVLQGHMEDSSSNPKLALQSNCLKINLSFPTHLEVMQLERMLFVKSWLIKKGLQVRIFFLQLQIA